MDELNFKNFDGFVKKGVAIIDFWAEWCGPCKMMEPVFEEVSKSMKGKVSFGKVNIDNNRELAERFQIMSIPTLLVFKDGEQVDRASGVISKEEMTKKIEEQL